MRSILSSLAVVALFCSAPTAWGQVPPPPPSPAPTAPPPPMPNTTVATPDGQWVYTQQYGWLWMPYDEPYTSVPVTGAPTIYAYAPTLGWSWVSAPWVVGLGPVPYYGVFGRARFAWVAHPWFSPRVRVIRPGIPYGGVHRAVPVYRGPGPGGHHHGGRGGRH